MEATDYRRDFATTHATEFCDHGELLDFAGTDTWTNFLDAGETLYDELDFAIEDDVDRDYDEILSVKVDEVHVDPNGLMGPVYTYTLMVRVG